MGKTNKSKKQNTWVEYQPSEVESVLASISFRGGFADSEHVVNAIELAESIVSFSKLCEKANKALNKDCSRLICGVKASPKEGSVIVDFIVRQEVWQALVEMTPMQITGAALAAGTVFEAFREFKDFKELINSIGSVISLINKVGKPNDTLVETQEKQIQCIGNKGTSLIGNHNTIILLGSEEFREALAEFASKPFKKNMSQTDQIAIKSAASEEEFTIEKDRVNDFAYEKKLATEQDEEIFVKNARFRVDTVPITDRSLMWSLTPLNHQSIFGTNSIKAIVSDDQFWEKWNRERKTGRVGVDTILSGDVKKITTVEGKVSYTVLQVVQEAYQLKLGINGQETNP